MPINQNDSKSSIWQDHIQDWQIEDWAKIPPPDLMFSGKSYDIPVTNLTAPILMEQKNISQPDYRYPNRKIKIGDKNYKQVAYPQLVHFINMEQFGVVEKLLKKGADVNALSSSGDSVITIALSNFSPIATGVYPRENAKKIVDLLLSEPYKG